MYFHNTVNRGVAEVSVGIHPTCGLPLSHSMSKRESGFDFLVQTSVQYITDGLHQQWVDQ